jgi:hypothetical protein
MGQVIQVAGSLLILAAFAAAQRGLLDQRSRAYLIMNFVGSVVLAVEALLERQWGFLLLEGVWALVSAAGLLRELGVAAVPRRSAVGSGRRGRRRPSTDG